MVNIKMKKLFVLLSLSLAVAIVFCGCGRDAGKSEETGIEIKKISEEYVYELYARVKLKLEKIDNAKLSLNQGFLKKWDLLKRKKYAADLALLKDNFDAAAKFLREAEAAADWIMNQEIRRYDADEKYSELKKRKDICNSGKVNAPEYASTIYAEAEKYEQQGQENYEKIEFETATRLYALAANEYKKASSTASAFYAEVYKVNAAKEKADKEKASQFASTIYQPALFQVQQAIKSNAQGCYDEALQLLKNAENELKNAVNFASQFAAAQQKANAAKEKADRESVPLRYAPAIYQEALSCSQQAVNANAQGKYDEALQLLESAAATFAKAEKESLKNVLPYLINSLVKIEAGTIKIGDRQLTVAENYYIGKYEVTQLQWQVVMGKDFSRFYGVDRPVERVSWDEAMNFCKKLNELKLAPAGYQFSLPTEAQWEFAARGGNKSKGYKYCGSNDINEVAWYDDNSGNQTHPVGEKKPNELGLYDMSGNVEEWCLDSYYANEDKNDVIKRGGCWRNNAEFCLVARRFSVSWTQVYDSNGFRLALVPVQ